MTSNLPNTAPKILVVDDDPHIRDVIRFALEDVGMAVQEAENGQRAMQRFSQTPADLIVLDVGMPEMDGFETCKAIRKQSGVPILFLTARDEEIDRVLGFELGGDDYVSKPFSPRELVLRIRAILNRGTSSKDDTEVLRFAELEMVPAQYLCRLGGAEVELTRTEFQLLFLLLKAPERVFPRGQLIEHIYGPNTYLSDRTVDSHIRNVRQKAAASGCDDVIRTVHGIGVKLGQCQT